MLGQGRRQQAEHGCPTHAVQMTPSRRGHVTSTRPARATHHTHHTPQGNWSQPYGVWDNKNTNNAMSAIPTVAICPAGSFAVSFYVRPSKWFNGASVFTGTTWVGTIHMTCSDGSFFTLDAQPGFNPGWADGTQTQITGGFTPPRLGRRCCSCGTHLPQLRH